MSEQTESGERVEKVQATSSTLILQWLTYAFWGWFAIALLWLTGVVVTFFTVGSNAEQWSHIIAYPLAAVIVLLLVAGITDFLYARREPAHKSGAASVIMVIHAVLFALLGIGALIVTLFSSISLMIDADDGGSDERMVVLYTSLIMIVIFALLVVRTVLAGKKKVVLWISRGLLAAAAIAMIAAGVFGPIAHASLTKQDRLIESVLPDVVNGIRAYTNENAALPESLADVRDKIADYSSRDAAAANRVIDKGLIRYTPNTQPAETPAISGTSSSTSGVNSKIFYYRLCTTYKVANKPVTGYYGYSSGGGYIDNPASHESGEVCYDLSASNKSSTWIKD